MEEENIPITQIELFKLKIKEKCIVHQGLLGYLNISPEKMSENTKKVGKVEEIFRILQENNVTTKKSEFKDFLETISRLWDMHQSIIGIKYKIETLLKMMKDGINNIFSEKEIFKIFRFNINNDILMILVIHNILSVETIIASANLTIRSDWCIIKYFYPEIRKCDVKYFEELLLKRNDEIHDIGLKAFVEQNDQNLDLFYQIRKEGKKEPKIIELIREDKLEEFILFIEHSSIDLNEKIIKEESCIQDI